MTEPVPIRVRWEGPQQLRVVANLPTIEHSDAQGVHQAVFAGQSDGISLLVGALERIQASELTIVGAESVVHGAEVLGPAYDALVDFYEGLIGRALPREPVVVVPDWLARYYNRFHYRVPVSAYGQPGHMRPLTHMGAKPVVTESALAGAVRAAERWSRTESPHDLLAATAAINYGLLESIWGRPYTFQTVAEEQPVAQGIAEYLLLRWAEHVLGAEFDADLRAGIRAGTVMQRLNEREGVAQQVLTTLIDIEERHGDAAVSFVLGWVYDRLAVRPIDVAGFEEIVALRVEWGSGEEAFPMIARLRHTLRLCFRPHLWLLYAVSLTAAVIMVISAQDWAPAVTRSFLMGYFEVFGSIAVVLGLGHVLTVDADDGARGVVDVPCPRSILALERIVAGFALAAGPLLVLAVAFGLFLPRAISEIELAALSMQTLLMDAVASWVFLAGLAPDRSGVGGELGGRAARRRPLLGDRPDHRWKIHISAVPFLRNLLAEQSSAGYKPDPARSLWACSVRHRALRVWSHPS